MRSIREGGESREGERVPSVAKRVLHRFAVPDTCRTTERLFSVLRVCEHCKGYFTIANFQC